MYTPKEQKLLGEEVICFFLKLCLQFRSLFPCNAGIALDVQDIAVELSFKCTSFPLSVTYFSQYYFAVINNWCWKVAKPQNKKMQTTDFDNVEIEQQYSLVNSRWEATEDDLDNDNSSARMFERSRIKALAGNIVSALYVNILEKCIS